MCPDIPFSKCGCALVPLPETRIYKPPKIEIIDIDDIIEILNDDGYYTARSYVGRNYIHLSNESAYFQPGSRVEYPRPLPKSVFDRYGGWEVSIAYSIFQSCPIRARTPPEYQSMFREDHPKNYLFGAYHILCQYCCNHNETFDSEWMRVLNFQHIDTFEIHYVDAPETWLRGSYEDATNARTGLGELQYGYLKMAVEHRPSYRLRLKEGPQAEASLIWPKKISFEFEYFGRRMSMRNLTGVNVPWTADNFHTQFSCFRCKHHIMRVSNVDFDASYHLDNVDILGPVLFNI
jgi:hypothetical protein